MKEVNLAKVDDDTTVDVLSVSQILIFVAQFTETFDSTAFSETRFH